MAISLQKGQKVNIGLSQISVGLGWNPNEGTGGAFDLDASAFMLNEAASWFRMGISFFITIRIRQTRQFTIAATTLQAATLLGTTRQF